MNQDFAEKSYTEIVAEIAKSISEREERDRARGARLLAEVLEEGRKAAPIERFPESDVSQVNKLLEAGAQVEAVRSQILHELADYIGSNPERHVRLARYIGNQPVVDLAQAGATPEELAALLTAQKEPQLAKVILTTGVLDNLNGPARAAWLTAMLPQQPTAEITLGR